MYRENEILVSDFVAAIAETLDLVSPELNNHHYMVAYICWNLARIMDLSVDDTQDLLLAAILHDIGAFPTEVRLAMNKFDDRNLILRSHTEIGYRLLKECEPLAEAAALIRYHHQDYEAGLLGVPLGSYIIRLADRISVILDKNQEVIGQLPMVSAKLEKNSKLFQPDVLKASLQLLNERKYVWIDIFSPTLNSIILSKMDASKRLVGLDALRSFAKVFSHIIDFRSHFTATHSSGVAALAKELSLLAGFSERESRLMEVAGFLHDLGKLAVPNSILEKPGPLDEIEMISIQKHTYYTYSILSKIQGLEQIAQWAAYHHERFDGRGYPFNIADADLSKLSRIMAVVDIVTALSEDRPYRKGMNEQAVIQILFEMAVGGGIDQDIVELVRKNYRHLNTVRSKAQSEAMEEYRLFSYFDAAHTMDCVA